MKTHKEPLEEHHPQKNSVIEPVKENEKERLSIKIGDKTIFLGLDEIAYLYCMLELLLLRSP